MTASQRPPVSVLFPVRDGLPFLEEAIASIEGQTNGDFEVLAVDDGSTDGGGDLLRGWESRDPRVRVLTGGAPDRALGLVAALELARSHASGQYLARMDADDITPSDRFERQLALLRAAPDTVLCGLPIRYVPREELTGGARSYERWINRLDGTERITRDLFVECPVAHPTFMVRADAAEAIGGYRDRDWPEDYDLVLRLWEAGGRLDKAEGAPHLWRDHPDRLSRTDSRYSIPSFQALKCAVLLRTLLAGKDVVIWGAGPTGKAFARRLGQSERPVTAFVDLDPRKIGQTIHGAPVVAPNDLGPPRRRFALAAVAGAVPRSEIREALAGLGWTEGTDFVAVA